MFRDSFVPPAPSDVERRISQMAKVIPSKAYASEENETTQTPVSTKGNDDEEEDTTVVEVASVVEEDDDDDSFLPRQDRLSKRMTMTGAVVSDQHYDDDEYETDQDEVVEEEVEEDDESTTSEESSNVQEEEEEEEEESYREPSDDRGDGSLDLESQQQQDNQEQPQSTTRSFPGERVNKPEPTICDSCLNALTSLPVVTLIILLLITVLGAGIGVGVASRNDSNDNGGSSGDDDNLGPLEDTTPFNPTIGDPLRCQLALEPDLPSVYDQCLCRSEIATIPIDVQERYNFYREELIPRIYRNFNEEISSCSARNQALVWLSSGNNGSYETPELLQRYALATMFHGMGGGAWQRRIGWTSYFESCTWINVVCNADGLVQGLELANNSLLGSVRSIVFPAVHVYPFPLILFELDYINVPVPLHASTVLRHLTLFPSILLWVT